MIAFWERAISLLLEIACGISRAQSIALFPSPPVDRTHIQYFRFALPAGFVQRLSESGNFSRWARLYKFAIALLIYQESEKVCSESIRDIVLTLRKFARVDEGEKKPVSIHEGLDSTLLILQHLTKEKPGHSAIRFIKNYGALPKVECYAGQLNQVFMNIINNAVDALRAREQKSSVDEIEANPIQMTITTSIISENWAKISIKDNGLGMNESVKAKIFDPFFTTKQVGYGTGLGFSISYQIVVEKHGGNLECISAIGEGTELAIEIPMANSRS
ncbi:ATP-binding protein [Microcoleus sp. LAD1_D5]|uniref:ATP-binding protein n=1 Tax=unclassified Microcoleus TaxID=2642155 RepID=UPI002FD268D5